MVEYTMTYTMRAKRRIQSKILSDREKGIKFLNEGAFIEEIAVELKVTYTQVHRELKHHYPDPIIYKILVANRRGERRVTLDEVLKAQALLKILPLKTVAAILGISWHRLSKLGPHKQRLQNTRLLGQVSEWLLGRFLKFSYPDTKWEVLTCLGDTSYAPDFHSEDQWWESKVYFSELNKYLVDYNTQYMKYLELIPKGTIVYWFGCRESIIKHAKDHGLVVFMGKDLLEKDLSSELMGDIKRFMSGDFIQLAKKWYGLY